MLNLKTTIFSLLGGVGAGYGFLRLMNCRGCATVGFLVGTTATNYLYHVYNNYVMDYKIWGTESEDVNAAIQQNANYLFKVRGMRRGFGVYGHDNSYLAIQKPYR